MTQPALLSCLCFSKDRPLQLEGYLRSLAWAFPGRVPVTVLYAASAPLFAEGYAALARVFPDVAFQREEDFGAQVLAWARGGSGPLVMFGCDDVVYYRPVNMDRVLTVMARRAADLAGFSLRLGRNFKYSHVRPEPVPLPAFLGPDPDVLTWEWRKAECDWNYPFEANGTVYCRPLLMALLEGLEKHRLKAGELDWRHPNLLESSGNVFFKAMNILPLMAAFPASCLVVPTVNRVQEVYANPIQGPASSAEELEHLRLAGHAMDWAAYQGVDYDRIHVGTLHLCPPPAAS